ncbi:hypothetical protein BVRB_5g104950 [Beta vulgaris subsp. vulgaris]|nr:hypothetical protein BVRB_5g104950 [Beta vulgaris subsp. vulgaris]
MFLLSLLFLSTKLSLQTQAPYESILYRPVIDQPRLPSQPHVRQYHHLPLGLNAVAPESIAFDCQGGGPYVGVSDGRILKWQGPLLGWTVFAVISPYRSNSCDGLNDSPAEQYCGRPLGLKFNIVTCELYIADSSFGLVKVGSNGGIATSVATSAEGILFRFLNALDIDSESGDVYFTDSSSHHHRWEYTAIDSTDRSGRLMRYNPKTGRTIVLLKGLSFANGVALSKKRDFVLVAETTLHRVQRYWLTGPGAGTSEEFIKLTGQPDNINRNGNGDFWVAQNPTGPIRVNESGIILESLNNSEIVDCSDVIEFNNSLWIGSVVQSYVMYTS